MEEVKITLRREDRSHLKATRRKDRVSHLGDRSVRTGMRLTSLSAAGSVTGGSRDRLFEGDDPYLRLKERKQYGGLFISL